MAQRGGVVIFEVLELMQTTEKGSMMKTKFEEEMLLHEQELSTLEILVRKLR